MTSSLQIIGGRATLTTGVGNDAPALASLADGDVVVGVSMWRCLRSETMAPRQVVALVARTALHDPLRSQTATARASAFYFDSHVLGEPSTGTAEDGSWDHLPGTGDHR